MIPSKTRTDFKTDEEWRLYCRLHWFQILKPRPLPMIFGIIPWMFWTLIGAVAFSIFWPAIAMLFAYFKP